MKFKYDNYLTLSEITSSILLIYFVTIVILDFIGKVDPTSTFYLILIILFLINELIRTKMSKYKLSYVFVSSVLGEAISPQMYLDCLDICGIEYKEMTKEEANEYLNKINEEDATTKNKEDNKNDT